MIILLRLRSASEGHCFFVKDELVLPPSPGLRTVWP